MIMISHVHMFSMGRRDFGAGPESTFSCPGCLRTLPTVLFDLDHIRSQARYTLANLGNLDNGTFVIISPKNGESENDTLKPEVTAQAVGGYVKITSGSIYNPIVGTVHSAEIWKNDLRNLQFLCSICNSSKQQKDWDTWGQGRGQPQPLSKMWKQFTGGQMTD
jgi:hypothetical protein